MKNLLVASTFGPDATRDWLDLQQYFISKYTKDYDFVVYLNNVEDETPFKNHSIIGRCFGELLYLLPEMFHQIYYYFRHNQYKNYLLIDSDCFPIKKDWYENLLNVMGDCWYAAPVRTDNLDISPHPCALFIRGEYIDKPLFFFRRPSVGKVKNLLGEEIIDIGTGFKTEYDGQNIFFPLMRSNFINVHPILASLIGDTFFHHGGGSRYSWFRSTPYWEKIIPEQYKHGLQCYEWLLENPERFIRKLRGRFKNEH